MGGVPDLVFVIDTNKEALAIKEANRLKIPVIAILDTNSDPDGIAFPVPANDDAGRAIQLYCDLVARAAIDGISRAQGSHGVDIGARRGNAGQMRRRRQRRLRIEEKRIECRQTVHGVPLVAGRLSIGDALDSSAAQCSPAPCRTKVGA